MSQTQPQKTYLKDYQEPNFHIPQVQLDVTLGEKHTTVVSTLSLVRNANNPSDTLVLDGENIELLSVELDGKKLSKKDYSLDIDTSELGKAVGKLSITNVPESFTLKLTNRIKPQENDACKGLYKAGSMFCTQCEAEGFRNITYYLDRPDVMSEFRVSITGDKKAYPYLLSNGNKVSEQDNGDGTHTVNWHDPSLKPSYLFALVAGNLNCVEGEFTTRSGRKVDLQILADKHIQTSEMTFALDCLKNCMKWDEDRFDREYDLDLYMIVATDKFNMGAMENKGLNIFNTSCVLGSKTSATDDRLQRIDDIIAHEYFHNWSGNRVTCRDWFQLSLKEGLTVFRDGQYNSDHTSPVVKRIDDVKVLRSHQFDEDASPVAHPIRPHFFTTINNFYTTTVYEKGAEVIHMIYSMLGKEGFKQALNLYFQRHDGQAVTTEEFVKAMEDGGNIDLKQFRNWYDQGGTPVLDVETDYDEKGQTFSIQIKQSVRRINGYPEPKPFHIPVAIGLLDSKGNNMLRKEASDVFCDGTVVVDITQESQTITFGNIKEKPVLSFLRNFSAPVKVNMEQSNEDLLHLMKYDNDGYNRWEACNRLVTKELQRLVAEIQVGNEPKLDSTLIDILRNVLNDTSMDDAIKTLMLTLPGEATLHGLYDTVDVDAIHSARKVAKQQLASALEADLLATYNALKPVDEANARGLKNLCLGYLTSIDGVKHIDIAKEQYDNAQNFTDERAAFACIVHSDNDKASADVVSSFERKWKDNADVMNTWLSMPASLDKGDVLQSIRSLMTYSEHFDKTNPNKVRAVISTFVGNHVHFHKVNGSGYAFLADEIIRINSFNPEMAARFMTPFTKFARFDTQRQQLMLDQVKRIGAHKGLSKDVAEQVTKILETVQP